MPYVERLSVTKGTNIYSNSICLTELVETCSLLDFSVILNNARLPKPFSMTEVTADRGVTHTHKKSVNVYKLFTKLRTVSYCFHILRTDTGIAALGIFYALHLLTLSLSTPFCLAKYKTDNICT